MVTTLCMSSRLLTDTNPKLSPVFKCDFSHRYWLIWGNNSDVH